MSPSSANSRCVKAISVAFVFGLTAIGAHCAVLRLPEPPEQHKPWHPAPAIPTNILSAAQTLFEQGFPDPRGCEYRDIEVEVGSVGGGKARVVKTRGWVLPKKFGTNQFAICWNGLVYPVKTAFGAASLQAEMTNAVMPLNMRPGWNWEHDSAAGEAQTVIFAGAKSTRLLLLLRCGETEAALKTWTPFLPRWRFANGSEMVIPTNSNSIDPYLEFASDWAWAMFDRMISAHQRGDEALALATAQQLAEVQPKIEAECARRGYQRPQYPAPSWRSKPGPYLGFLGQLPQILADLERRAKEPAKINIIEAGTTNYPDRAKRIAALIDDLDLVNTRQWDQPGWVELPEDPIVSALIQEGEPAVEPLLNCLEHDKRLTRSVGLGRDFFRGRTVIPVHDAAKAALQSILRAGFADDAPEIRAYWNKYKGLKLEDRWYAILKDDAAWARWGEAAANIVQPENVRWYPGGLTVSKAAPTNTPVRMDGEILRAKTNPSVTELMARRALEVPTNNVNAYDISTSCQMALYLATWDPAASLPVARTLSKRACTVMKYSGQQLGPLVTKLALARARAGDPQAFDDYASWMATTSPDALGYSISECLQPLRQFPTNQTLQAAAEKMFGDTNSNWSRLPWNEMHGDNPIGSDLVKLPAFRQLLVRELGRTNVCGSFTWHASGQIDYAITNYQSGGYGSIAFQSGTQPTNGTTSELRWCDWIAFSLSQGKRIPFFDPFATAVERDAAIENARKLLGQPWP